VWHKTNVWHDVTQKELHVTQIEIYVTRTSQIRHFVSHKFFFVSCRVTHIFFLSHCVTHIFLIRFFWDVWHDVTQQNRGSSYYAYINFCFFCVTFFHISIFFFFNCLSVPTCHTIWYNKNEPPVLRHIVFSICVFSYVWHNKTEPPVLHISGLVSKCFTRFFFFMCVFSYVCHDVTLQDRASCTTHISLCVTGFHTFFFFMCVFAYVWHVWNIVSQHVWHNKTEPPPQPHVLCFAREWGMGSSTI